MGVKLGKGYGVKGDKVYSFRHKLGDASAVIRRNKNKDKARVSSRAKATSIKAQRP